MCVTELHSGAVARGHTAGDARQAQRHLRQHREDLRLPPPLLSARAGALPARALPRRPVLPAPRAALLPLRPLQQEQTQVGRPHAGIRHRLLPGELHFFAVVDLPLPLPLPPHQNPAPFSLVFLFLVDRFFFDSLLVLFAVDLPLPLPPHQNPAPFSLVFLFLADRFFFDSLLVLLVKKLETWEYFNVRVDSWEKKRKNGIDRSLFSRRFVHLAGP